MSSSCLSWLCSPAPVTVLVSWESIIIWSKKSWGRTLEEGGGGELVLLPEVWVLSLLVLPEEGILSLVELVEVEVLSLMEMLEEGVFTLVVLPEVGVLSFVVVA